MTVGLTPQQSRCLAVIKAYIAEHDISPSFEEIGAALGLRSKSDIHRLVTGLVQRGYIDYVRYRARSIRILDDQITVKVTPEQLTFLREQAAEIGEPIEALHAAIIENWISEATGGEPT